MSAKSTVLNLRLDPEDRAWLESQAEELGLDSVSAVMRSLIRRARKGTLPPAADPWVSHVDQEALAIVEQERVLAAAREAERARKKAELQRQMDALDRGEEYVEQSNEIMEELPYQEPEEGETYRLDEVEVPADRTHGELAQRFSNGFKVPGSSTRPRGLSGQLQADQSPNAAAIKRNFMS